MTAPLPTSREPLPPAAAIPVTRTAKPAPGALGTADPLIVEAAADDGSWVAVCQARADTDGNGRIEVTLNARGELGGDALGSFLVTGEGPGTSIDQVLAVAPGGQWLVVQRAGRALLLAPAGAVEIDLSARQVDLRSDAATYRDHRAFAFDPSGQRFAYLRGAPPNLEVVLLELGSGREQVLAAGAPEVWRLAFDPTGRWLLLHVVAADTNGNGRLEWPVPAAEFRRWRCQGPLPRFAAFRDYGDRTELRVAQVPSGPVQAVPELVTACGDELVLRDAQNHLLSVRDRDRHLLANAECGARLIDADCTRGAWLAACTNTKDRRQQLALLYDGRREMLDLTLAPSLLDHVPEPGTEVVPLLAGTTPVFIDFVRKRAHVLEEAELPLGATAEYGLVRRGQALTLLQLESGERRVLPVKAAPLGDVLRTGSVMVVAPAIVDLKRGELLGTVERRPLALTGDGHVLVAEGRDPDVGALALGPLRWRAPAPEITSSSEPKHAAQRGP